MKVVVDTNVIVSALMNVHGTPAKILSLIVHGALTLLYDTRIILEYSDVLSRKEFGFSDELIHTMIDYFRRNGECIHAECQTITFSDETDKKFYEVHKSGKSHYLITGNIKHFPKEDTIIIPKSFIHLYEE